MQVDAAEAMNMEVATQLVQESKRQKPDLFPPFPTLASMSFLPIIPQAKVMTPTSQPRYSDGCLPSKRRELDSKCNFSGKVRRIIEQLLKDARDQTGLQPAGGQPLSYSR